MNRANKRFLWWVLVAVVLVTIDSFKQLTLVNAALCIILVPEIPLMSKDIALDDADKKLKEPK